MGKPTNREKVEETILVLMIVAVLGAMGYAVHLTWRWVVLAWQVMP